MTTRRKNIVTIDLEGRSSLADAIVIANGRSQRHVGARSRSIWRDA
jgi:ribosome-associated protein